MPEYLKTEQRTNVVSQGPNGNNPVSTVMHSDMENDIPFDTVVSVHGSFVIAGKDIKEFNESLGALINKFRI